MLSVPLDVVFHEAHGVRAKPLLTRAEAQCFISVTLLAHEMDSLVEISSQVLQRRHEYHRFACKLQQHNNNPRLFSLLPILYIMGQQLPGKALDNIRGELLATLSELGAAMANLRQYSEQNWTLSESLLDAGPEGERVAKEKRKLSDIQDELCNRIQSLLDDRATQTADETVNALPFPPSEAMHTFCERIMSQVDDRVFASPPRMSQQSSQRSSVKGQSQGSQSVRSQSKLSQPLSAEKENQVQPPPRSSSTTQMQSLSVNVAAGDGSPISEGEDQGWRQYGGETQHAAEALSSLMNLAESS
jgi:hypothetical protein